MDIGKFGIWKSRRHGPGGVREAEELGFGAFWVGGSPSVEQMRPFVEAAQRMVVGSSILNVWQHEPADVARDFQTMPGNFLLGIGIGHPEATSDYTRPLKTMRDFFDGLDAGGVPKERMIVAALGPKMLDLSAERSLGTIPYFVPVEHTRFARERLGADALIAPEIAVVLETDDEAGRTIAREYAASYLRMSNYTNNLLRLDYAEADIRDGGSDRLIDAVVPHGSAEAIAEVARAHLDAGADHVCLQPLGHGPDPLEDYRALADALLK
jgi:probable F420-dependent oxidoreductase